MAGWKRRRKNCFDSKVYVRPSNELASASSVDQNSELDIQMKMIALKVAPSVVSLRSLIGKKMLFLCSGIIVESKADEGGGFINYILTAASLLAGPHGEPSIHSDLKVYVYLQDGKVYRGEVHPYAVDFHYNVALIKMKSDAPLPEPIVRHLIDSVPMKAKASADPFQSGKKEEEDLKYLNIHHGDQVIALARTSPRTILMVETGYFSLEKCVWDCQELYMTTCKTYEYFIGGPLINGDGEVVGIVFSKRRYSPFLPSNIAWKCLERFKKHEVVHRPSHGILASNLHTTHTAMLEKLLMNFPDIQTGVIVKKVKSGSPAALAGIQPQDVIICCNGTPLNCLLTFSEILWDSAGKCVDMEVRREDGTCLKVVMAVEQTAPDKFNGWPISERWRYNDIRPEGDPEEND